MPESAAASSGTRRIFVSYAWGDASSESGRQREVVEKLCQKLEAASWEVIRDRTATRDGDLISAFMKRITRADLVVIVLSDKYLRSPYCMTELYGIYQGVQGDKTDFLQRVIPLTLDDAKFFSWPERVALAERWQHEVEQMKKSSQDLSVEDFKLYKAMQDWHNHVGDMLAYVNDKLHPHGFEQIVKDDFRALLRMVQEKEPEEQYLKRLIGEIEAKARLWAPLSGVVNTRPNLTALDPWKDDPGIELLIRHEKRKRAMDEPEKSREYDVAEAGIGSGAWRLGGTGSAGASARELGRLDR